MFNAIAVAYGFTFAVLTILIVAAVIWFTIRRTNTTEATMVQEARSVATRAADQTKAAVAEMNTLRAQLYQAQESLRNFTRVLSQLTARTGAVIVLTTDMAAYREVVESEHILRASWLGVETNPDSIVRGLSKFSPKAPIGVLELPDWKDAPEDVRVAATEMLKRLNEKRHVFNYALP